MSSKERYFTVAHNDRSYTVIGNEVTTLDTVWASQKCFFLTGSVVKITAPDGHSRLFMA